MIKYILTYYICDVIVAIFFRNRKGRKNSKVYTMNGSTKKNNKENHNDI